MKGIQYRNYQEYRAKKPRPLTRADAATTPPVASDIYSLAPLQLDGVSLATVAGVQSPQQTKVRTRDDETARELLVAEGFLAWKRWAPW